MRLVPLPPGLTPQEVEKLRWETFGHKRALRLGSVESLVQFTLRRGFVLLLPQPGLHYPSVLEATVGRPLLEFAWDERVANLERWVRESVATRQLLSAAVLAGQRTLLAPACLPDFYALSGNRGDLHDHERLQAAGMLSQDATALCDVLLRVGSLPESDLQERTHLAGEARAERHASAVQEVVHHLLVVEIGGAGASGRKAAPAASVYDLLPRVFPGEIDKARSLALETARQHLACRYLRNVLVEESREMARVLGWDAQDALASLQALAARHLTSVHPSSRPRRHLFQAVATDLLPAPPRDPEPGPQS